VRRIATLLPRAAAPLCWAATVGADPCDGFVQPAEVESWAGGAVAATGECGGYVVSTDASGEGFSWGALRLLGPTPSRFELAFSWQRLSGDGARSMEVHVPGGVVLVKPGRLAFFESEAQLSRDGWRPLRDHTPYRPHEVRLVAEGRRVRAWIDGRLAGYHTWRAAAGGEIRLAFKGFTGARGRMLVRRLRFRPR
jgi:hypothetical protein